VDQIARQEPSTPWGSRPSYGTAYDQGVEAGALGDHGVTVKVGARLHGLGADHHQRIIGVAALAAGVEAVVVPGEYVVSVERRIRR
jgi:hypothetical protein